MQNNRCLIFGGAGSIGSELVRQLAATENHVYIFDNDETRFFDLFEELGQKYGQNVHGRVGDVRDKDAVKETFREFKPDLVFIASAYKHVTPSAWNPREYTRVNIDGALNIIEARNELSDAFIVNVSTDKVVHANSIMGATKRVAELAVRDANGISVRFGNVMGSRGSVLEIWQRQIEKGEPLTVTDKDMTRYMMTIPEAVKLVIRAAEIGQSGDTVILDMGEKVNILQLAKDILKKAGKEENIKIIGARPGETLTESLMFPDEEARAERVEDFWIIHNSNK